MKGWGSRLACRERTLIPTPVPSTSTVGLSREQRLPGLVSRLCPPASHGVTHTVTDLPRSYCDQEQGPFVRGILSGPRPLPRDQTPLRESRGRSAQTHAGRGGGSPGLPSWPPRKGPFLSPWPWSQRQRGLLTIGPHWPGPPKLHGADAIARGARSQPLPGYPPVNPSPPGIGPREPQVGERCRTLGRPAPCTPTQALVLRPPPSPRVPGAPGGPPRCPLPPALALWRFIRGG